MNAKGIAVLATFLLAVHEGVGATRFADVNSSNPIPPYTYWNTASTNIQDAIDAAVDGDLVLVTNGVYNTGGRTVYGALTNRVVVDKAITVQSVNGPNFTSIEGNTPVGDSAVRCAYLTNGATLDGFTLTSGAALYSSSGQTDADRVLYASGAGAWCESVSAILTNCILTGNEAEYGFGGVGGGAYSGTLRGCVLSGNKAVRGGGAYGSVLNNCVLSNNWAISTVSLTSDQSVGASGGGLLNCQATNCFVLRNRSDGSGGGAASSTLVDCGVEENSAFGQGGGVYLGTFIRCRLARNAARDSGGGVYSGTVSHCLIADNYAVNGGGASLGIVTHCEITGNIGLVNGGGTYQANVTASALVNNSAATNGGGAFGGTLNNCTVAGNSARDGGGTYQATLVNSIIYFNQAASGSNYSGGTLTYCCAGSAPPSGSGNITNNPLLADGYHLSATSPCVGAGGATPSLPDDIDGDTWSSPPSIGCDEYQAASASGPMTITVRRDYLNARPGAPIQLAARLEGHAASSTWDFGDGTALTNQPYTSHNWTSPGVYAAKFIAANGTNPGGVTNNFEIQVAAEPVLYVAQQNPNSQPPFLSWANAATNIQDAVDQAFSGGSTVLVSNGLYRTGGRANAGVLTNRVCLSRPVTLQSLNGLAVTVIEGRRLGAVPYGSDFVRFPGYSNGDDAARCVYGCDGSSLIGFTFTNGATRAGGGPGHPSQVEFSGGGVFCESTNVLISDCVIVSNSCNWFGAGAYQGVLNQCQVNSNLNLNGSLAGGGGVAFSTVLNSTLRGNSGGVSGALSSTLSNCVVMANSDVGTLSCLLSGCIVSSNRGGGVRGGYATDCVIADNTSGSGATSATLSNCLVYGNRATDGGGAYNCVLNSCSVSNNYAGLSGGGVYWDGSTLNLPPSGTPSGYNNLLAANTAGVNGGGLYVASGPHAITNWTFTGNASRSGAGVYVGSGSHTLQDCRFTSNSAASSGGGVYTISYAVTFGSCEFTGNSAAVSGGGVHAQGGSLTLQSCTFTQNSAGANGGGLDVSNGRASCSDSTFFNNTAQHDGGGANNATLTDCILSGNQAHNGGGAASSTVASCSLYGNLAASAGGGLYFTSSTTLTNCTLANNRATDGGGVFVSTSGGSVDRCTFAANYALNRGGGLYSLASQPTVRNSIFTANQAKFAGAGFFGKYLNCSIMSNSANDSVGGVYVLSQSTISSNCIVNWNHAANNSGGVFGGTWTSCQFIGNAAGANGGAANAASLTRSIVTDNKATLGGGAYNTLLNQCLLARNFAAAGGGVYSGDAYTYAINFCTVVANSASNSGGGVFFATNLATPVVTSILYFNQAPSGSNYSGGALTYCCSMPLAAGTGNITNDPVLIDRIGGNFRLQTNSACINTGSGGPGGIIDLDGRPRIVGVKIDMGAFEFQGAGVGEFIFWLQQNGLPTAGSADYADADSDLMNNWQEWISGTSPTNAESVLKLVSLAISPSGAIISWQSVAGKSYWIERATDPSSPSGFSLIQSNLPGLVGLTSFTDSEATNRVEYFYRVGVK